MVLSGVKTTDTTGREIIWPITTDISQRKQAEQELLEINAQLESSIFRELKRVKWRSKKAP
ncbi:MAG: hypothetical protein ACI81V_000970 [Lentimonas sp.]